MRVNLWKISQVEKVAKIFTAVNYPLGTCVPFRIFKSPFRSCEPSCEILKAKFHKFSLQVVKIFTAAKHPLGTCAISHLQSPISQLRNELWTRLRNHLQVAKWPSSCEMAFKLRKGQPSFKRLFKPLIISNFILHNNFNLRKKLFKLWNQRILEDPLQRKPRGRVSEEDHLAQLRVPSRTSPL